MYKRIYDSDSVVVDYQNDGKPMIRISEFEDGHWVGEHFVELPDDIVWCKDCKDCKESNT